MRRELKILVMAAMISAASVQVSAHDLDLVLTFEADCNNAGATWRDDSNPPVLWGIGMTLDVVDPFTGAVLRESWSEFDVAELGLMCLSCFPGANKEMLLISSFEPTSSLPLHGPGHSQESQVEFLETKACDAGYAHIWSGTAAMECRRDLHVVNHCSLQARQITDGEQQLSDARLKILSDAQKYQLMLMDNLYEPSVLDSFEISGIPRHCSSLGEAASGFSVNGIRSSKNYYLLCGDSTVYLQVTPEATSRSTSDDRLSGLSAAKNHIQTSSGIRSETVAWTLDGLKYWALVNSPADSQLDTAHTILQHVRLSK